MTRDDKYTPQRRNDVHRRAPENRASGQRVSERRTSEQRASEQRVPERRTSEQRAPERRTSEYRAPRHATNRYSRYEASYQTPKKASPAKTIVLVIVVLVVVAAVAFGVYNFVVKPMLSATSDEGSYSAPITATPVADKETQVNSAEAEAAITMNLKGDHDTIVLKGETYIESGAHAVERRAGDISLGIQIEGQVDTSKVGDYTITYTATSSDGLKVSRTRTVHVVDSMDKDTNGIPVLMYHYVYSDSQGYHPDGAESNSNYILDTDLAAQLDYLVKNDYYFPSYAELSAYIAGTHSLPAKSVILTFDDGSPDFLAYGIPVLEQYKVPATSFIVGIDNIEPCTQNPSEYVTYQSHSYNMHHAGGDYGHGGAIGGMTQAEIVSDLKANINLLGSSDAFAYPYGDAPEWGIAAVHEAGILCAFTTEYDYVHVGDDPANLSRIRVLGTYDLDSFVSSLG